MLNQYIEELKQLTAELENLGEKYTPGFGLYQTRKDQLERAIRIKKSRISELGSNIPIIYLELEDPETKKKFSLTLAGIFLADALTLVSLRCPRFKVTHHKEEISGKLIALK